MIPEIDENTQKTLNTPLKDGTGAADAYKEFLEILLKLINEKKIDLYRPSSLINYAVYDKLNPEKQGKVDFEAVNLMNAVREINGLYGAGFADTYQMENLVLRLKNTKERLEVESGDLFII